MNRSILGICVVLLAMLSSCSKWQWPPYESDLRAHFEERRETFQSVGREMAADELLELTSAHLDGTERKRHVPIQPTLTDAQRAKYKEILGDRRAYLFQRKDDSFSINVYVSDARGKHFTFWYVNGPLWPDAPMCSSPSTRAMKCGDCVERLDESWYMAWSWFPDDVMEYDDTCSFLTDGTTFE